MTSKNLDNYHFLKNIKPDLYKLCLKMEEDLLITPISMLAYSTRFLEYILYDVAKSNRYEVDREIGFVKNIYELIKLDYMNYPSGDLLIKAYVFRNLSIHNTDIINSLKQDKKTALELNKKLFYIADKFYGDSAHTYIEPIFSEEQQIELTHVVKQEKSFDKCIICGKSSLKSKSNFCPECDKLLNYREFLSEIISKNGKNTFFRFNDINYQYKARMIKDLTSQKIIEKVGNEFHFLIDNLDKFFILTDSFMEIDKFLTDFKNGDIERPTSYETYNNYFYPYDQVSSIVNGVYVGEIIALLKNGYSLKYSLQHVDIEKSEFESWYMNKKSEFIDGNKDDKFVELNELLIEDYFKSLDKNQPKNISEEDINFWSQYFDSFNGRYDEKYSEYMLKLAIDLLKKGYSKEYILKRLDINQNDLNRYLLIQRDLAEEYGTEINKRKDLILKYVEELSLKESIEKSKLLTGDIEHDKEEFFNGKENMFYQNLTEILMKRYLNCRKKGVSTDDIISALTIEKSEVEMWMNEKRFKDFQNEYSSVRLDLFNGNISDYNSKIEIMECLEISEGELNEYIDLGKKGIDEYIGYYNYFQRDYYPNLIKMFFKEFKKNSNLNSALAKCNLTKEDLNNYLDEDFYQEFINIKCNILANAFIKKGKINNKLLKKIGISKKEYNQLKQDIDEIITKKQVMMFINDLSEGEVTLNICNKVHCDMDSIFEWIYKGSLGDEKFKELSSVYWEEHLYYINDANNDLRDDIPENSVRKNFKPKVRHDYGYWKKWGLIDKKHIDLTEDDVDEILKEFDLNK